MKQKFLLGFFQSLLTIFLAVVLLGADGDRVRFENLGHRMMCACGCNQILLDCNHVGCTYSDRMRQQLMVGVQNSGNDDTILQAFVKEYGTTVLAAPGTHGFDRVAWIMPFAVFIAGHPDRSNADSQLAGAPPSLCRRSAFCRIGSIPPTGAQGDRAVIVAVCILFAAGLLAYVFAPGVAFERSTDKSRLTFLEERKQVVYENLRDLNFDYNAGKYPPEDYDSLRSSLEAEAAEILAEIAALGETAEAV